MDYFEYQQSGGREIYYAHEQLPEPPDGYKFTAVYHMGKIMFYRLDVVYIKKDCGCS